MGSLAAAAAAAAGSASFDDETSSAGSCWLSLRVTDESDDGVSVLEGVAIDRGTGI